MQIPFYHLELLNIKMLGYPNWLGLHFLPLDMKELNLMQDETKATLHEAIT